MATLNALTEGRVALVLGTVKLCLSHVGVSLDSEGNKVSFPAFSCSDINMQPWEHTPCYELRVWEGIVCQAVKSNSAAASDKTHTPSHAAHRFFVPGIKTRFSLLLWFSLTICVRVSACLTLPLNCNKYFRVCASLCQLYHGGGVLLVCVCVCYSACNSEQ